MHRLLLAACLTFVTGALLGCEGRPSPVDAEPDSGLDAGSPVGDTDAGAVTDGGADADGGTSADAGTVPSNCPAGWKCPAKPLFSSQIGAWYGLTQLGSSGVPTCPNEWAASRFKPLKGYYDSSAVSTVDQHFAEMRGAGIDFIILDFTNGISPDPKLSHIYKSGETVLARNADPTAPVHMPFALAIGAQLWSARSLAGQMNEADFILSHYAAPGGVANPAYFKVDGRPLLVSYNTHDAPNVFQPNWTDARFFVGRANPVVSTAVPQLNALGTSWWGWLAEHPNNLATDVVTVSPGADNTHRCDCIGSIHYDRSGGSHAGCNDCDLACTFSPGICPNFSSKCSAALTGGGAGARGTWPGLLFELEWLRAIKKNPRHIVIASYNDFGDETGIEPALARTDLGKPLGAGAPWVDSYGDETPDWYLQIASAYAHLRTGLQPGVYYQDEDSTLIFTLVNGVLTHSPQKPRKKPVILLPAGTLRGLGAALPPVPALPPEGTVIVAPGLPHAVVTRGVAVRFEVAATALKFGAPVSLTAERYEAIPYAGTVRAQAPVFVAPALPPAFESDLGELWEVDCLEAISANGSHVNTVQVAAEFNSFAVRSGLHCR